MGYSTNSSQASNAKNAFTFRCHPGSELSPKPEIAWETYCSVRRHEKFDMAEGVVSEPILPFGDQCRYGAGGQVELSSSLMNCFCN
jgi:hypothetical protein